MRRKIDDKLEYWLKNRSTALLIKGARQVGKSYSIINFIKNHLSSFIIIDFSKNNELLESLARINSSQELLLRLSSTYGRKLIKKDTIIFLDEIQLLYIKRQELIENKIISSTSQDLLTAMKDLVQKGDYRFILSGSLLGVTLNNIVLYPMGYMDVMTMYPMDFEEYLWAKGIDEDTIAYLKKCFINKEKVDELVKAMFLKYFREYVIIGGMPEVVKNFIKEQNLYLVNLVQNQIIGYYKMDVTRYISDLEKRMRVMNIYDAISGEINAKNKKFVSSHIIDKNYLTHNNLIDEYLWLYYAGIAIPIYNVDEPVSPLSISANHKTLKLFVNDIGLLNAMLLTTGIREKLLNGEKEINFGAPYENAVAQELIAHGYVEKTFYYSSKKQGEVDFILQDRFNVLPIEVKSGKPNAHNTYNHAALNNIISLYDYNSAYVFGEGNIQKESEIITSFPIYMIMFINFDE